MEMPCPEEEVLVEGVVVAAREMPASSEAHKEEGLGSFPPRDSRRVDFRKITWERGVYNEANFWPLGSFCLNPIWLDMATATIATIARDCEMG